MHDWQAVAREVLTRDWVVPEDLARKRDAAVGVDEIFIGRIIIVPHDASRAKMVLKKPVILITSHSVIQQVLINRGVQVMAVGQVQREKALLVEPAGRIFAVGPFGVEVLRRFALDKDR